MDSLESLLKDFTDKLVHQRYDLKKQTVYIH
jgi:hypothetical protein